jgi:hypothetical protein
VVVVVTSEDLNHSHPNFTVKQYRYGRYKQQQNSHFLNPPSANPRFTNKINPWRYSSDEPWPAEQPPLAVFPDCTRWYWVDM